MSIFKGNLDSSNKFKANDDIRALHIQGVDSVPAQLVLETGESTPAKWYIWMDSSDNLRINEGTAPTSSTQGTAGSVVTGASNAGAARELSNLATVACNTTLASDTDSTDDLGTSSIYWANAYVDKIYLNSTATLASGGAGVTTLVGNLTGGVSGTGSAFKFFATTAGGYIHWDDTAAGNDGGLIFTDSASLLFGDASDFIIEWDATNLTMDCKTDNTGVIAIGGTKDTDVLFNGATASSDMLWDASADALHIYDDVVFAFGDSQDFTMSFNATAMIMDNKTANTGNLVIGASVDTDVEFHGTTASYDCIWNASDNALTFMDATEITFGSSLDLYMRYEGTGNTLDIGQTADGTGSVDFIDTPVLLTGADSAGTLLTIAGNDTTGNTDTVSIAHKGTGAGLKITCGETDSLAAEFVACAAQTTSIVLIDGNTSDWDGADNVGMLHITQDAAMIHAGASMIYAANSGKPINSQEGIVARFIDTGTNVDTDPAYTVSIESTNNFGLHIVTGAAASSNLVLSGLQAQTAAIQIIDGSTGTGWDGADNVGMLHLVSDSTHVHAGATMLYVANSSASVASAEGTCARFLNTGTATAGAVMVEISGKDTTEVALNVPSGTALFDDGFQSGSTAIVATATGATTGTIGTGTRHCTVTVATDADDIVILPAPVVGREVWLHSNTVAYELRASGATVAINGGAGATAESAVLNTDITTRCVCVGTTDPGWIVTHFAADGTESKADAAA